jgi:cytochrome c-type biogenesis protein
MTQNLLLALGAGLLAAVNPCGFALLPAYLSLLVLDENQPGRGGAIKRALTSTAALTLGFVVVFGIFGLVISPVVSGIERYLPFVTVVLGLVLVLAGGWLLAGRTLPAFGWSPRAPRLSRRFGVMIGFGASYALASLTCSIAPFLAIVITTLRANSFVEGFALFVAYGLGMGILVGTAALAVALARTTLVNRLKRLGGLASRTTGALLLLVGAYVGYYGWWELHVLKDWATDDPIILAAASIQARLSAAVGWLGVGGLAAIVAALFALALLVGRLRGSLWRQAQRQQTHPETNPQADPADADTQESAGADDEQGQSREHPSQEKHARKQDQPATPGQAGDDGDGTQQQTAKRHRAPVEGDQLERPANQHENRAEDRGRT